MRISLSHDLCGQITGQKLTANRISTLTFGICCSGGKGESSAHITMVLDFLASVLLGRSALFHLNKIRVDARRFQKKWDAGKKGTLRDRGAVAYCSLRFI